MRRTVLFLALLPRNACVAVLRAYRAVISPLYGDVCRYYPSCSTYTLQAIQLHGAVKGIGLGAWRIARCNPWTTGGIDDVPAPHHNRYRVLTSGFVVVNDGSGVPEPISAASAASPVALAATTSSPATGVHDHHHHGELSMASQRKG